MKTHDAMLTQWIKKQLPAVTVELRPPSAHSAECVSLYLFELDTIPQARTRSLSHYEVYLRYLLTAWHTEPETAHQWIEKLLFAALQNKDFDVAFRTSGDPLWQALGIAPCPAFVIGMVVREERVQPEPKIVKTLVLQGAPSLNSINGMVILSDGKPVSGAAVALPAYNLATNTNDHGWFSIPNDGHIAIPVELLITVNNKHYRTTIDSTRDPRSLIINLDRLEE